MTGPATRAPRLTRWLPVLTWTLFLLWLGGRDPGTGPTPIGLDKVAHLGLYGILGVLAGRAWRIGRTPPAVLVLALGLSVGALDEWQQSRVPARMADPWDFMADAAGVVLGFAIAGRRKENVE